MTGRLERAIKQMECLLEDLKKSLTHYQGSSVRKALTDPDWQQALAGAAEDWNEMTVATLAAASERAGRSDIASDVRAGRWVSLEKEIVRHWKQGATNLPREVHDKRTRLALANNWQFPVTAIVSLETAQSILDNDTLNNEAGTLPRGYFDERFLRGAEEPFTLLGLHWWVCPLMPDDAIILATTP